MWCVHACKCTTVLLFSYWSLTRYPCVACGVWGAGHGGCLFRHRVMTTARPLPHLPPILLMMPQSARHLGGDSPLGQAVGGVEPGTALQTPLSCVCAEEAWRAVWDQRGHPPTPTSHPPTAIPHPPGTRLWGRWGWVWWLWRRSPASPWLMRRIG